MGEREPGRPVTWGIIGCGGIARRRMIPALADCTAGTVVAVMDVDRSVTDEVAAEIGARPYYVEADLLSDSEVRAVYVATPVHRHHRQVIEAASAGKHVLVEKPIAASVADAEEMVSACKLAGVYLTEGYMMKFHALNAKARAMVQSGDIGKVVFARAQLSCWYPAITGAWRQDPKLGGGGALMDMAVHCYDLLEYILDCRIVSVFARTDTLTFDYPVEDSSTTLLRFQNGAHAVVDAFYNIPDSAVQGRLELYGNEGSILAQGTIGQAPTGTMVAQLGSDSEQYDPQQRRGGSSVGSRTIDFTPVNMYAAELDYLSCCIEEKTPPSLCTGEDGLQVLRVAEAAYESSRSGREVAVA